MLVEWRGPPVNQLTWMLVSWGIPLAGVHRNNCKIPPPFLGGGVGPTITITFSML